MNDNVFWLLELAVKPGCADAIEPLMTDMVASTRRDEPGTLSYEWFVDESAGTVHIHERYADSAAVMAHLDNFGEKFAERFLGSMEPTRLAVYGEPSEEVREALSGFGAVFHPPAAGFSR